MGRKLERYKRREKSKAKQIRAIEKSLGINAEPKMCPMCGTQMMLKRKGQKQIGGVVGEGNMGGIYIVEPSELSSIGKAQKIPLYICPKCEYRTENRL